MKKVELVEKYWRLTPFKSLGIKDSRNRYIWLFKCDCGNEIQASASDVKLGRKKSCGCLAIDNMRDVSQKNILPNNQSPFNKLFGRYKREAKNRNYEFSLTEEEFRNFINKKCHYCGSIPNTELCIVKNKTEKNTLLYNGIDRKNNLIGYIVENCIPCCPICNRMKMTMEYNQFKNQVKNIYKHQMKEPHCDKKKI